MMFQLSVHLKTSIVANAVEDVESLEREVEFVNRLLKSQGCTVMVAVAL